MGLLRTKIKWTVPGAGTAFSVLHFHTTSGSTPVQADADQAATMSDAYCTAIRSVLPSVVQIQVNAEVEEINEASNALIGVWPVAAMSAKTGSATGTATWAAPVGAVISWSTAGIRKGRRVRGRTFIVPCSSVAFDTDGTLSSSALGTLGTAAASLRATGTQVQLAVYARPTVKGATDGAAFNVLASRVPDMGAVLRSRRS